MEIVYPKPKIKSWLGEGEIIPVEAVTKAITNDHISDMAEKLDIYSCIDYWFLLSKGCIRGLASRVQWPNYDWSTFSVRYERITGARTEYSKKLHAIENDYLYPYWTIQSYLNKKEKDLVYGERQELLNAALCKTKDLILYIKSGEKGIDYFDRSVTKRGVAYFYAVPWNLLRENHDVKIYDEDNMKKYERGNLG